MTKLRKTGNGVHDSGNFRAVRAATIDGFIMAGAASAAPQGIIAHVGNAMDLTSQSGNDVGYMDVTGVNAEGVEVDMWVWAKD